MLTIYNDNCHLGHIPIEIDILEIPPFIPHGCDTSITTIEFIDVCGNNFREKEFRIHKKSTTKKCCGFSDTSKVNPFCRISKGLPKADGCTFSNDQHCPVVAWQKMIAVVVVAYPYFLPNRILNNLF